MKHMRQFVFTRDKMIELIEMYNTASKYIWVGMDITCEIVTFTFVHIVKCKGLFVSLNDQTEFELLYDILI